jgi:hypothetical protein
MRQLPAPPLRPAAGAQHPCSTPPPHPLRASPPVQRLAPAPQGSVPPYGPVSGPDAWLASDFPDPSAYTVELNPTHISELEAAVRRVLAAGRVRADGNYLSGVRGSVNSGRPARPQGRRRECSCSQSGNTAVGSYC